MLFHLTSRKICMYLRKEEKRKITTMPCSQQLKTLYLITMEDGAMQQSSLTKQSLWYFMSSFTVNCLQEGGQKSFLQSRSSHQQQRTRLEINHLVHVIRTLEKRVRGKIHRSDPTSGNYPEGRGLQNELSPPIKMKKKMASSSLRNHTRNFLLRWPE